MEQAAPQSGHAGTRVCRGRFRQSGHPTLRRLNFGVGRLKDNDAIAAMFPEEMHQVVYYKITPSTYLRRPTS